MPDPTVFALTPREVALVVEALGALTHQIEETATWWEDPLPVEQLAEIQEITDRFLGL